jgi:hypothetical protein
MFQRAAPSEHRRAKGSNFMRSFVLVVSLSCSLLLSSTAVAQTQVQESPTNTRRLGGHLFAFPQFMDNAFIETTFATRTAARYQRNDNLPIGPFRLDLNAVGAQESVDLFIAFGDCWGIGVTGTAQFLSGVSGEALATQGALYNYGASINAALRLLRIDTSGTQLAVRGELFGLQGGGRLSILPLLIAIRDMPRDLVGDIGSYGDLLVTPASWWGFAGSVNLAQAIGPIFSLQASFRLDVKRFTQSPFFVGQGRVDISSTGWLPEVGVALGANPPGFPISFLLEYRAAAQDVHDPASLPHNTLALGGYYSARPDLQLGAAIVGEFGLPDIPGFDVNGTPVSSERGEAVSGLVVMRYFW